MTDLINRPSPGTTSQNTMTKESYETTLQNAATVAEIIALKDQRIEVLEGAERIALNMATTRTEQLFAAQDRIAELEAENARLKGPEWHYLPETPRPCDTVIIPRGEFDTPVLGFYGEKGNWYLNTHHGGVVKSDFTPRAWCYPSLPIKHP